MSDNQRQEAMILEAIIRVVALRDVVAVLLATQARASTNPDAFVREMSEGLDLRLSSMNVTETHLVSHIERIRDEYDWIVAAARSALGQIPSNPSTPNTV